MSGNHEDNDEKIMVQYRALDSLNSSEEYLIELSTFKTRFNVKVIGFRVNESSHIPFLSFCLFKNKFTAQLQFPTLVASSGDNLICLVDLMINCFLEGYFDDKVTYKYKGCCEFNDEIYVFLDFTNNAPKTGLNIKMARSWFVLPDEIMNKKHVCNIMILEEVEFFFRNNASFLFLNDLDGVLDTPIVVYSGAHYKNIYFQFMFGKIKTNKDAIFGSHYYFTDYIHAIREGGWSKDYKPEYKYDNKITENDGGKYIKGGIIRYAIFLGYCLYKENYPLDFTDESPIKQLIEEIEPGDLKQENTIRLTDYDSTWDLNYDSLFLGNLDLNINHTPMYVLKDYKQQISLSYHFIDKSNLGNEFDETQNYQIK